MVARISQGCVVGNHSCGSGYGNYVYLKASDGTCAITAHLSRVSVSLGQQLRTYDLIGLSGNTGNSTGAHLHYGRVNCSNNQSLPWAPIEGGSLAAGTTVTSQNRPGASLNGGSGSTGGYEMAFQANTGNLITVGSAGGTNWQQGMKSGTSPSITTLSNGGYEMAFQANTGELITVGTAGGTNRHQGMMPGTSPDITALPNGGYEMAFQANPAT